MHLHASELAAEVPGFSQEQLARLARSVESRRQQLEEDINAYIQRRQDELRQYEVELVDHHRAMHPDGHAEPEAPSPRPATPEQRAPPEQPAQPQQAQEQEQEHSSPEEHKKQKKHGRVHKREQELYGLVTPVFLPLLDARGSPSPTKKEKKTAEQASERRSSDADTMPPDTAKERSASDPAKRSRTASIKKKSALRHSSAPRNRKRVSLVIDDQIVHPSDTIQEPALTSPSSETTSATNSTASLDDMIDPRLTSPDTPLFIEHHSLPLTMSQPKTSPTKTLALPFSDPTPILTSPTASPPTPFAPPSYATRSFLDPPPEHMPIEDIPATDPDPIHPSPPSPEPTAPSKDNFSTYVGGITGSGTDDVNQVGSYGYPSSLGASYLESYMQGRPLSVRMAAAQREGNEEEIARLKGLEERRVREDKERREKERVLEEDWEVDLDGGRGGDADEDGDFMGSMDGF